MDPAVTAALIAAPVAVVAAGAAFAAGRMQARGAHHGPVDAVRRQHQREAYAALLVALQAFAASTSLKNCEDQARREFEAAGVSPTAEQLRVRKLNLVAEGAIDPVRSAAAVVELEGPADVAAAASNATEQASMVRSIAETAGYFGAQESQEIVHNVFDAQRELDADVRRFTLAARMELNRRPK
ncbi:hypothetical protein ACFVZW_19510 [Streptomyces sp. NPDC059567]|uniref:hypothetical protein n=1 Tax=Streptomyces sp. NPDC059567 TaxID=3346867 RepID=UPI0036C06017